MEKKYISHPVKVGNLFIGGNYPVVIQSMTNTDTMNTKSTCEQILRLVEKGCQMVRITAPTLRHAHNLECIKNRLYSLGCTVPLIADIHFLPEAALEAAKIVDKVRINPGNYSDKNIGKFDFSELEQKQAKERIALKIAPLLEECKKNGTAIRIGVNHGSLSERILAFYGNTPEGMVASALEFVEICEQQSFYNLIISMKSSDVVVMNRAVRILVEKMQQREHLYPLHLGVTEAGNGADARIISSIGIGSLLRDGIGDTIRVSLTENPENEIQAAFNILSSAEALSEDSVMERKNTVRDFATSDWETLSVKASIAYGSLMLEGIKDGFSIGGAHFSQEEKTRLVNDIYQAAGVKSYKTRFIACPSCGRTKYDIEKVLGQVKNRFSGYKNLKIAVMGCIVNGPGEMMDADYGYIGCGNGLVNLYQQGLLVKKNVPEQEALEALEVLIKSDTNINLNSF
ncbi:MAG: (E)-4-hydroxy-3-methylbut-2-enyl-diphosphate synthase [Bacteroidales bacterium]